MKKSWGLWIVMVVLFSWGCGSAPDEVRPVTPVPPPPTPVVTPVHLGPTPTPHCANFKVCEGQGYGSN
jgi:hypothetical protein